MKHSGAEILIQTLVHHHVNTIFGYPGACVISILDKLFDHQEIVQVLVRHEQGAIHAACGYAQQSNKAGVVIVTSGPGATNTVTGITDAFLNKVPMVVITGQVSSNLIGTDAFQEVDMLSVTATITKWNYQIRRADEMESACKKAFAIAMSAPMGPVLLDITKDAQTGTAEYNPSNTQLNWDDSCVKNVGIRCKLPENRFYAQLLKCLNKKEIVLVVDKNPNDFYNTASFGFNKVIKTGAFGVRGFGLPAAIGAKFAALNKTICLVVGTLEFQATAKELGVIKQQRLDVKIILLEEKSKNGCEIKNPNFMLIANAYEISGQKISRNDNLHDAIEEMLNFKGCYLLQITN